MSILTASRLKIAQQEIANNDAVMADLIARLPAAKLVRKQSPFHVLATSVINQQLSQQAAAAIEKRIALLTNAPFNATAMLQVPKEQLRAAGLSHRKIEYLHALAQAEANGVLDEKQLNQQSDSEVIRELTAIHGIGKWTAEMFLMFCLRRCDVLSLGDAGLLRAARLLYGKRLRGDDCEVLEKAAKKWQPWRSVGCYYLWRSLDKDKK